MWIAVRKVAFSLRHRCGWRNLDARHDGRWRAGCVLAGAATSALTYLGLLTIPARYLFSVTSSLITLLAAGLAAQAVAFLQQAGYIEVLTSTVWDTSWLFSEGSVIGRLVRTLIGSTDRPSAAQLVVDLLMIAIIVGLMRLQRLRSLAAPGKRSASEISSDS
jgi:high-affinity iron transporter